MRSFKRRISQLNIGVKGLTSVLTLVMTANMLLFPELLRYLNPTDNDALFPIREITENSEVNAASLINLSLKTDKINPSIGDLVTIEVIADNFPNIVSFEEVSFNFDVDEMQFDSVMPGNLPDAFTIAYENENISNGEIRVSGKDETAINQLAEQVALVEDGSIENEDDMIDPSYKSDEPVVLFRIKFRVKENAEEEARFYLSNAREFKESNGDFSVTNLEDGITLSVATGVSSDATITDLKLNGYDLIPAFNSEDMIYEAQVGKEVTDVVVSPVTSNSNATIRVTGNTNLEYGNNTVTVEITAQDGYTKKVYYIIVSRPDSFIPTGAGLIDSYGKTYYFAEFPTQIDVPKGFVQTTRQINGYDVPVFARDDVMSVLVYLQNEEGEEDFYFYNISTRATTLYNSGIIIKSSKVLTPAKIPVSSLIPSGFNSCMIYVNGQAISGYKNSQNLFIAYFKDENGKTQFYQLDTDTMEFSEFHPKEKTYETEFKVLFLIFLLVSAVEGMLIIFITATISQISKSRAVPRAKRV